MTASMGNKFESTAFPGMVGIKRRTIHVPSARAFFTQGEPADCMFFLREGHVKLTATSKNGKAATVALLFPGNFLGEGALANEPSLRLTTATAITACSGFRIEREEMIRALQEEQQLSQMFLGFLLARNMRTQADLIDQLFNSSEKRLARILLLMADFDKPGKPETTIPNVTQEALAEMVGTTRSRINFFMNRFRSLGFIKYNGEIRVHRSLLNVILRD
jgi:CRP/FNR family cyclic AMP-dependent transcriptional regulator